MADEPRRYSTKQRAKRIELEYFKRLHPFRRLRLGLSIALPVLAGLWLAVHGMRGDQTIYTSGPVSTGHAMFGTECRRCHVPASAHVPAAAPSASQALAAGVSPAGGGFLLKVTDQACATCHAGPVHQDAQIVTPACTTCHVEHVGHAALASLDDSLCTACHANLELRPGNPARFEAKIASFGAGHPEFAVDLREGETVRRVRLDRTAEVKDAAQVKLNHQKHVKVGLKGLEDLRTLRGPANIVSTKDGLQLACTFCHETGADRVAMQPISYARHCGPACHPLDVDARLPGAEAPHDKVPLVHAYLRTLFLEAFEDCQALRAQPASGEDIEARRKRCQDLELLPASPRAVSEGEESGDRPRGGRLGRRGGSEAAEPPAPPPEDRPRGGRLGRGGSAPAEPPAPPPEDRPRGSRLLGRSAEPPAEPPADAPRGRRLLRGGGEAAEPPAAPAAAAAPGAAWVAEQLQGTERLMYKQKCGFCHVMAVGQPGPLPATVPTTIPARWLPHAVFDHGVHRPVACTECHGQAVKSTETADVMLPRIAVCRDCHHERRGARTRCVECHLYHDKTRERPLDGPFTIRQLAGAAARPAKQAGQP